MIYLQQGIIWHQEHRAYKQLVMTTGKCKERAPFGFAGISHIHGTWGWMQLSRAQSKMTNEATGCTDTGGNPGLRLGFINEIEVSP